MFFSLLPNLEYSQNRIKYRFTDSEFVVAKNIFKSIQIDNSAYATNLFKEFLIKDSARPDYIAEKLYNDANYDWVILLTNNIKNLHNDWPLSTAMFESMLQKKYSNPFDTKHWVTKEVKNDIGEIVQPKGLVVYYNPSVPSSFTLRYVKSYNPRVEEIEYGDTVLESVSYYEYEQQLNEKKRVIQVLNPRYLDFFVTLFKASVGYLPNEKVSNEFNALTRTLNTENIFNNKSL